MDIRVILLVLICNLWGCSLESKKQSERNAKDNFIQSIPSYEKEKDSLMNAVSTKEPVNFTLNGYHYSFSIQEFEDSTLIFLNQKLPTDKWKHIAKVRLQDPYSHYRTEDVNNDGQDDLLFRTLYVRGNDYYVLFLSQKKTPNLVYIPQYEELSVPEYNKNKKWIQSSFYIRDSDLYKETWKWQGMKLKPFRKVELERVWDEEAKKVTGCKLHTYSGKGNIFQKQQTKLYASEQEAIRIFEKSLRDDYQ